MNISPVDQLLSTLIPALKDGRFCDCSIDSCECGENSKEFEWVWDTESANPDTIVLSCQNRETLFHPRSSDGTTAIRGSCPFKKGHVYYWEIKMLTSLSGTDIVVGVGTENAAMNADKYCSLIGSNTQSWGYSFQGRRYHNGEQWDYGSSFGQGSIIGVKLDMWSGDLEFYLNRKPLGVAFTHLNQHATLYPMVSSTVANSSIRVIHSSSHPVSLAHHCLRSLRNHWCASRDELRGIPSLERFMEKAWWIFSDEEALYPEPRSSRKKDYHWCLQGPHPAVTLANLLRWNMRRFVQPSSELMEWHSSPIVPRMPDF